LAKEGDLSDHRIAVGLIEQGIGAQEQTEKHSSSWPSALPPTIRSEVKQLRGQFLALCFDE